MGLQSDQNGHPRGNVRSVARGTVGDSAPIDSESLFGTAETLQIDHEGHVYTLRKTRNGKLILTK